MRFSPSGASAPLPQRPRLRSPHRRRPQAMQATATGRQGWEQQDQPASRRRSCCVSGHLQPRLPANDCGKPPHRVKPSTVARPIGVDAAALGSCAVDRGCGACGRFCMRARVMCVCVQVFIGVHVRGTQNIGMAWLEHGLALRFRRHAASVRIGVLHGDNNPVATAARVYDDYGVSNCPYE